MSSRSYLISAVIALVILPGCKKQAKKAGPAVQQDTHGAASDDLKAPLDGTIPKVVLPALQQAEQDKLASEEFRNVFYQIGVNRYTPANLNQLVFLPNQAMLELKPDGTNPVEALFNLSKSFEGFKPSDFYDYGKSVASKAVEVATPADPVTLVIVPGIFSEFVDTFAFHEVVSRKDSSFAKAFQTALISSTDAAAKIDSSFDFDTQAEKSAPISDFLKIGSIDDATGKARVQVITLTSPMFSGESLGKLEDNAEVYIRRISKIFALIGVPKKVVIVGYSRGAAVALELLSTAEKRKDSLPWVNSVQGMVSVGGVLYGAALADAAFDPKDPLNGLMTSLQGLSNDLELVADDASTSTTLAAATRNTGRWVSAGASMTKAAFKLPINEGLGVEGISSDLPQMDSNIAFMKRIAFEKFDFSDPTFKNYFLNVKKFKWIMAKIVEGVATLSTESRVKWWQTHQIPARIKYYSIAGTMGNVSSKADGVWSETGNSSAYAVRAMDYLALRVSYYDLFRVSKLQVTDSQVSLDRSRFMPEFNLALNPTQAPFSAQYLGILGADHWGMIFPYAMQTSGNIYSPFPRDIFAESLGLYLANKLK